MQKAKHKCKSIAQVFNSKNKILFSYYSSRYQTSGVTLYPKIFTQYKVKQIRNLFRNKFSRKANLECHLTL